MLQAKQTTSRIIKPKTSISQPLEKKSPLSNEMWRQVKPERDPINPQQGHKKTEIRTSVTIFLFNTSNILKFDWLA